MEHNEDESKKHKKKDQGKEHAPEAVPAAGPEWTRLAKSIRDNASWIVKSFVAISVVLVGSGPLLVNLGDLKADRAGATALAGATLAFFGIGLVVWQVTKVMAPELTDIAELTSDENTTILKWRTRLEGSRAARQLHLLGFSSLNDLLEAREKAKRDLEANAKDTLVAAQRAQDPVAGIRATHVKTATDSLGVIDRTLRQLLEWATFETLAATFRSIKKWVFVGAAMTALGAATYLGALKIDPPGKDSTTEGANAEPASGRRTANLVWSVTENPAANELRSALGLSGQQCARTAVELHGGTGTASNPWDVGILPNASDCSLVRFSVARPLASVAEFKPKEIKVIALLDDSSNEDHVNAMIVVGACVVAAAGIFVGAHIAGRARV
ncbi:MAG TPA: hypothetical protein VNA57_04845 [Acidimicrobiales bacterium]|nr:hypothetical protein [Acidimicrobiales bacterium]